MAKLGPDGSHGWSKRFSTFDQQLGQHDAVDPAIRSRYWQVTLTAPPSSVHGQPMNSFERHAQVGEEHQGDVAHSWTAGSDSWVTQNWPAPQTLLPPVHDIPVGSAHSGQTISPFSHDGESIAPERLQMQS